MFRKILVTCMVLVFALSAGLINGATFRKGAKVEVEWKGQWFSAEVIETKRDSWKIHYDGYEDSWDEWVSEDRIRKISYNKGDVVEVEWKGKWYKSEIIDVKKDSWKIHYDGYEDSWDEWVSKERIRPL